MEKEYLNIPGITAKLAAARIMYNVVIGPVDTLMATTQLGIVRQMFVFGMRAAYELCKSI
jgi:hypothetical protein